NDILDTGQGEDILNALLNLSILVHYGAEGSISIFPPREHCNSQGVNDMGCTPEFLPGYRPVTDSSALSSLANEWGIDSLQFSSTNPASDLLKNCTNGTIKFLHIAGEDPVHSYYKGAEIKNALQIVPFLVVQDVYMTETAKLADIILPTTTSVEKEGSFTNMTRHVQKVMPATPPQYQSRTDHDIFVHLAEVFGKKLKGSSVSEVQEEISKTVPMYKGTLPGTKSRQWSPEGFKHTPYFQISDAPQVTKRKEEFPHQLVSNNHMFHIGSYTQYAKALTDIGPECVAELHSEDAEALGVNDGDRIVIESSTHKVEVPILINTVTVKGMVYLPKNWVDVPVNMLRNGEEGPVSVRISKAS
ncbi:MAG TPA: NADH-quinone oxidoreductase, subunit G, partial [Nitrospinaceae bacterium]|nr:NADH-quinone oxidoreductase, subunit G [Nitrospinaceae bacterium]